MEMERIHFDFYGAGRWEDLDRLDTILHSGFWTWRKLDPREDYTGLLMLLLQRGSLAVYERRYRRKDISEYSEDVLRGARLWSGALNKQDYGASLLPAIDMYSGYEPKRLPHSHGALFYPEQRICIRNGGLTPEKLFEFLEVEGCDKVEVYPAYRTLETDEDASYIFERVMSRETLLSVLEKIQEIRMDALTEKMRKVLEKRKPDS